MDFEPIRERVQRTAKASQFGWRAPPTGALRRALRDLVGMGGRLDGALGEALKAEKEAQSWQQEGQVRRARAMVVVAQLVAKEPALAASCAHLDALSPRAFLARLGKPALRVATLPPLSALEPSLREIIQRLEGALRLGAEYQRVWETAQKSLARLQARWDVLWQATVAASTPLREADPRVAALFV